MSYNEGFPPIVGRDPRILILGSMPGVASLEKVEYYGHPRNAFWPVVSNLLQQEQPQDYELRCTMLKDNGIAVWDVLYACVRPGSLDSNIDKDSMRCNDFPDFFAQHPSLQAVFFNGGKAEEVFRKRVLRALSSQQQALHFERLPSTSPAMAALNLAQKQQAWAAILRWL